MSFVAVAFLYPLLLAVLAVGAGLLVERLAGRSLPAPLVPALGFAALIVVSQFTVLSAAIAPLTPWVLVAVALLGFVLAGGSLIERWRARGPRWWVCPLAAALTYVTVALPLIAAGRLTFPGYLLDTTAGIQIAGGEWILHHGVHLPVPYPAYGAMLHNYFGSGYPSGGQVLMAGTGWLAGQDLLWLYFPFQVFGVALSSMALMWLAERAGLPRLAAGFAGWIAAIPALVTAYALMGSIKELTALPMLLLLGSMIVLARDHARIGGVRGAVPFGVAAAGAVGAIGPAAAAWIGVFGLVALVGALPVLRSRMRRLAPGTVKGSLVGAAAAGAALVAVVAVLAVPTLARLSASVHTALGFSSSNVKLANDPGNLLRPLRFVQAFGVWAGESHRVDPRYLNETYALIGVAMVCFVLGLFWLARRRAWTLLLFIGASLIVWAVLDRRGTEWTSAKVMMLTSPVIVLVAMIGAFGDIRRQRALGVVLAGVLAGGVLASDALLYHGTNMAPARFVELRSIGQRFARQVPTLLPDFDEYAFYLLRSSAIDSPGFADDMRRRFALLGPGPRYGYSYDVDDITAPFVQQFSLIVQRRSPRWSRPPGNFELVFSGRYYDVWRRAGRPPRLHIPAGAGMQAVAALPCSRIHELARRATAVGGALRYAARPPNVIAGLANANRTPGIVAGSDQDGFPDLTFDGPGSITSSVELRAAGVYRLWVGGSVDRTMRVMIDGTPVGVVAAQSGGDGNMIDVASAPLSAGPHEITLVRGGGGLGPGNDSGAVIDGIYLQAVGPEQEAVATIRPGGWRSLCGRSLDWIEVT